MDNTSFVHRMACPNCSLHCLYTTQTTSSDPLMDGTITDMPDWEAMGMVGANLGYLELKGQTPNDTYTGTQADRLEGLNKTQFTAFLHDNYGIDYIEGGTLLALLMELTQRKLITPADLDGIDMQWGDAHAVDAILKKIVKREGIGDVLANGTWETAKYFANKKGNNAILDYPVGQHRYGQPAHDVRGFDKDALEYVTVGRPSEHTGGGGAGFSKGDYPAAISGQNVKCSQDSLVYCIFAAGHWGGRTTDLVKAATGWTDFVEADLAKVGARQYALSRIFDIHTQQLKDPKKEWDMVSYPKRWFEPLPTGGAKGKAAYDGDPKKLFDVALPAYWKARGWTEDKGIPTTETLKSLGIDDIAESIAAKYR
jgi:aldehyde:ferredoxin oxidoreductase